MEEIEKASNEITSNEMSLIEMTSMKTRQLHSSQKEAMKRIVEFSGESAELDIDEWLFDLTNLFSVVKLKDETKVLEIMGKLKGPALRWYQENLRSFTTWENAEQSLRDRFKEYIFESQLMQEFFQIQQEASISFTQEPEHGEKIKDYLGKLAQEARKNILKSQCQYKTRYDLHRQELSLKINDLVLVKTRNIRNKFDIRYEGPFKIIKQLGSKTFIVQHVKKLTLTRQVTMDVIVPLVERWNLNK